MICFQWWRDDALNRHNLYHTPCCTWVRPRIISAAYALSWERTGCMWEPVVCRWAPTCYSRLPRRSSYHIQETVKLCHILLDCGRGAVPMTLMDRYWSGWYILECDDNFFPVPKLPKALIGQYTQNTWQPHHDITVHCADICFCMAMFCGMCQMQKNPSFPPISFLDICVLMNENSYFLFFSFLVLPLSILVLDPFPRRFSVRALMFFSSG